MPDLAWAQALYMRCYKHIKTECVVNDGERIQIVGDNIPTDDGMTLLLDAEPIPEELAHLKSPELGAENPTSHIVAGDSFPLPDSLDELIDMFKHGGVSNITDRPGTPPTYTW